MIGRHVGENHLFIPGSAPNHAVHTNVNSVSGGVLTRGVGSIAQIPTTIALLFYSMTQGKSLACKTTLAFS